jgi:hypothetical protein
MNRLNSLLVAFIVAIFTIGIYSCVKDEEKISNADISVESRSKNQEVIVQKMDTDPCNCGSIYQQYLICTFKATNIYSLLF